MSTVLFTWELGRGLGHLVPMLPLARGLSRRGHKVFMAARDVASAPAVFRDAGVSLIQAPFALNPPVHFPRTLNYAQLLANVGWGDYDRLFGLASAWRNLLGFVRPDAIVFDHSPTAMLAARCVPDHVAKVAAGLGFFCPPDAEPMPAFFDGVDGEALRAAERRVLGNANRWLRGRGVPELRRLGQLFGDVDETFLQTFTELDHYPGRAGDVGYYGPVHEPGGEMPVWPGGEGPRVYAYLKDSPAVPHVLGALVERGCRVLVFDGGIDAAVRRQFASRGVRFARRRLDLARVGAECDLAVHNANHGTLCQLLLAGRPMLQVPITLEQKVLARAVDRLGAAGTVSAKVTHSDEVGRKVDALLAEAKYAEAAKRFAEAYAAFDPAAQVRRMVGRVEGLMPVSGKSVRGKVFAG
jgi:UDP:flavonoid glycosyltransferase YjiC (YdhE family)